MSFWNNVIDKRTQIEARKAELELETQIGTRSHPLFGDVVSELKYGYQSVTKYPRMLIAGMTGGGGAMDKKVDPQALPESFQNTDLAEGFEKSRAQKQKRIDTQETAYRKIFCDEGKGLWSKYTQYRQLKNVAAYNSYQDNLAMPHKATTLETVGSVAGSVLNGIVAVSGADLGMLAPVLPFSARATQAGRSNA